MNLTPDLDYFLKAQKQIEDAIFKKPKMVILQDAEHPICAQCGNRLNIKLFCPNGCGIIMEEPR